MVDAFKKQKYLCVAGMIRTARLMNLLTACVETIRGGGVKRERGREPKTRVRGNENFGLDGKW